MINFNFHEFYLLLLLQALEIFGGQLPVEIPQLLHRLFQILYFGGVLSGVLSHITVIAMGQYLAQFHDIQVLFVLLCLLLLQFVEGPRVEVYGGPRHHRQQLLFADLQPLEVVGVLAGAHSKLLLHLVHKLSAEGHLPLLITDQSLLQLLNFELELFQLLPSLADFVPDFVLLLGCLLLPAGQQLLLPGLVGLEGFGKGLHNFEVVADVLADNHGLGGGIRRAVLGGFLQAFRQFQRHLLVEFPQRAQDLSVLLLDFVVFQLLVVAFGIGPTEPLLECQVVGFPIGVGELHRPRLHYIPIISGPSLQTIN